MYDLAFDFEAKRVAATVLEGFDAGSTFIRHYDRRWEYRVTSGEFSDCRRAFLSEDLPEPELPSSLELVNGDGEWEGRPASEWRTESDHARVTVWQDVASGLPVAVTDEGFNGTAMVPLMTHRLESVTVGAPPPRQDGPAPALAPRRLRALRGGLALDPLFRRIPHGMSRLLAPVQRASELLAPEL